MVSPPPTIQRHPIIISQTELWTETINKLSLSPLKHGQNCIEHGEPLNAVMFVFRRSFNNQTKSP